MTSVTVIDPGLQTTVQDAGRVGWEHLGVPRGGAMDFAAFRWANRLAGNGSDLAVLESVLQGVAASADDDVWVGITGAGRVEVDGRLYPPWSGFLLSAGSVLRISRLQGARCYVAVHGGIDLAPVLGSRSTYLPAHLGGLDGRALRVSDRLP